MTAGRGVVQWAAGLAEGDAITREILALHHLFLEAGLNSVIHAPADYVSPELESCVTSFDDAQPSAQQTLIYHFGIASELDGYFNHASGQRILRYHNITPPDYYRPYDASVTQQLETALTSLHTLCEAAEKIVPVSAFNALSLPSVFKEKVMAVPLQWNEHRKAHKPDPVMLSAFQDSMQNILYVGRLAPNKNLESLIVMFAYLQAIQPNTRLIIAGSKRTCPKYYCLLNLLAARMNLNNVVFTDYVNESELSALYASAAVFVTTSSHEGYCFPLIEAMSYQVPVIAPDKGGMPEALGDGGVIYNHLNAEELAMLTFHVLNDQKIRSDIILHQMHRMKAVRSDETAKQWMQLIHTSDQM